MFFGKPTLHDIRFRLSSLVDDFDHSDLRHVIKDIEFIMREPDCSRERASYLNSLVKELYRCESGTELSSTRFDRYLDKAERS